MKISENKKWLFLVAAASVLLFIMFFCEPLRLDDWAWGGQIGIDRLNTRFEGYNGRYVGNIIVLVLLRLPTVLRAIVETAFMLLFFKLVYDILEKNSVAFIAFTVAFACIPLRVGTQCITWTSGYANYFMAAVALVYVIKTVFGFVFYHAELKKYNYILFPVIIFLSQLILETATIYIFVFLVTMTVICCIRKNKKNIIFLGICVLSSVAGLILMYSNSAYTSAATDQNGTYKKINFLNGFLSQIDVYFDKFIHEMMPDFVSNYNLLILLILAGLIVLWGISSFGISKIMCWTGTVLSVFFMYDMLDSHWETLYKIGSLGSIIRFSFSLLMYIYLIVSIAILIQGERKIRMLIIGLSQVILVAPLIVASPLGARCYFHNYIFWALILAEIVICLYENIKHLKTERLEGLSIRIGTIFIVMMLALNIGVQIKIYEIYNIRQNIIDECKTSGVKEIVLPEVPWSTEYSFGANVNNKNVYWINNYKQYYNIPDDTDVKFMDYFEWLETR